MIAQRPNMRLKLINRLAIVSRVIILLGFVLAVYLVLSVPFMQVVADRHTELGEIEAASSLPELKAHASALAVVGDNATHISRVLFGLVIVTLIFFMVLSALSLVWLKKLRDLGEAKAGSNSIKECS